MNGLIDENEEESMDYLDIKYGLAKKGYNVTLVAKELGLCGPQSIQQVCTRIYRSARVEKRIAEILDLSVKEVFPDHRGGCRKKRNVASA